MDNLTHSLMGALLGQVGLKRSSRLAMPALILGANAPDIDVFAPLLFDVQGIAFHRGPTHAIFGLPILAAAIVGLLWLYDRWRPDPDGPAFRPWPLFLATLIAVASHPALDFLNTYGVNILAPLSPKWVAGDAIFIIDWVFWVLMGLGIWLSARRYRKDKAQPWIPARVALGAMLAYIAINLAITVRAESWATAALTARGIRPTEVIASPPPFAFWRRSMLWRDRSGYGFGYYAPFRGLTIGSREGPLGLDDPRLALARADNARVAGFLYWSRAPLVLFDNGRAFLTDQRFVSRNLFPSDRDGKRSWRYDPFLIPIDGREK